MPYGPFEQIAPKSCSNLQEFVSHLKRLLKRIELNLDFEQSAICSINKYELDWSEMFFFFLLFCFALVACALIAVALQRFKSSWQSATDGHMSQHAGNILSIFPLYCSIILYLALQRIIYWESATDRHVCMLLIKRGPKY